MNICFFGVGGVGGYFGALVARFSENHKVFFIARGEHGKAISNHGLTIKKSGGIETINVRPTKCTDSTNGLPICDVVILSVKAYDLPTAVLEMSKIVGHKTIVLPLLNGVDIVDRIRENLDAGIVLPSCVYVGTHIESPGVIYQKGGACEILFGRDSKYPDTDLSPLTDLFEMCEINFSLEEEVDVAIWSKYIFIAAYGLVTASYRKSLGEVYEDKEKRKLVKAVMLEIVAIAFEKGVALPNDIVNNSIEKVKNFPFEARTSFQRDIETEGKKHEGEIFGGTIIKYGEMHNIPVPITLELYK